MNRSTPAVRWLGAFGTGPSLADAVRWELNPGRAVSVAVHRETCAPLGRLGLLVDTSRSRLSRATAGDGWARDLGDGVYAPTRCRRATTRSWRQALAWARQPVRGGGHHYVEAIVSTPVYIAIVDAGATPAFVQTAARITGLPVVSWEDICSSDNGRVGGNPTPAMASDWPKTRHQSPGWTVTPGPCVGDDTARWSRITISYPRLDRPTVYYHNHQSGITYDSITREEWYCSFDEFVRWYRNSGARVRVVRVHAPKWRDK
jgi:hypothetical protein